MGVRRELAGAASETVKIGLQVRADVTVTAARDSVRSRRARDGVEGEVTVNAALTKRRIVVRIVGPANLTGTRPIVTVQEIAQVVLGLDLIHVTDELLVFVSFDRSAQVTALIVTAIDGALVISLVRIREVELLILEIHRRRSAQHFDESSGGDNSDIEERQGIGSLLHACVRLSNWKFVRANERARCRGPRVARAGTPQRFDQWIQRRCVGGGALWYNYSDGRRGGADSEFDCEIHDNAPGRVRRRESGEDLGDGLVENQRIDERRWSEGRGQDENRNQKNDADERHHSGRC